MDTLYIVKVKDLPVRYSGITYQPGETFEMESEHFDGSLVDIIEEFEKEPKTLDKMTIAEMKDYAEENDIDLGDAKKHAEILEAIQAAESAEEKQSE